MVEHDALIATREAYDGAALAYAQLFRDTLSDSPLDRAILTAFAEVVGAHGDGEVADLGCGPGHITAHLDQLGLTAFGVDVSPAMIKLARQAYPGLRFDEGSMAALNIADGWAAYCHVGPSSTPRRRNSPSSWRSSSVFWHLADTFWSAFRQATTRRIRRRSSITQSRRPTAGGLIISPRCCASSGWPKWPGW
jgi:SAM-dependent methyltransferase